VGNNPLKYRDPTGHVKETPEQEAMEEGAVGGVMAEKSEAETHTTIGKNIPSIDLTQMKKIQQEVLCNIMSEHSPQLATLYCLKTMSLNLPDKLN
jgi:hypothetical protein